MGSAGRRLRLQQRLDRAALVHRAVALGHLRERQAEVAREKLKAVQKLAKDLSNYSATIEANANDEGHLYGSILAGDISKALKSGGYDVTPDQVRLEGPLKELGMYTIRLQLHPEVESEVKVWVVPVAQHS